MSLFLRFAAATAVIFAASTYADVSSNDFDIEGAKARYDAQRSIADRALGRYRDYERVFHQQQSSYTNAVSRLRAAESTVANLRSEITRIERDLQSKEDELPRLQSTLSSYRNDRIRLVDDRSRKQRDHDSVDRQMRDLEQQVRRAERELDDEKRKPTPDANKVRTLEARVRSLQSDYNDVSRKRDQLARDIRSIEDDISRKDSDIASTERKADDVRLAISRLSRERDGVRDRLSDAQSTVAQVRGEVSFLSQQLEAARTELALREADYRREDAAATKLNGEYQQVLANYNRERDRVVAAAAALGSDHGGREGAERGSPDGVAAGSAEALRVGSSVGTTQAKARDRAKGYRDGRDLAKTDASLAASYRDGRLAGAEVARRKAVGESFPRGYASALESHFAVAPPASLTIDASTATESGADAPWLSLAPLSSTQVAAPVHPIPTVPGATVPVAPTATPSKVTADRRYFREDCSGMVRPEFGSICSTQYASSYDGAVASAYRSAFSARFAATFAAEVGSSHAQAFAVVQTAEFEAGRAQGAREQGVLDGFAEALPRLSSEQDQAGRAHFTLLQKAGTLVRAVGAQFTEANDGFFAGGENVSLRLVLDNFGGQASLKDGLVLKTTKAEGLKPAAAQVPLPSLAGETRVTVDNALRATIDELPAGAKAKWEGVLERKDGTKVLTLAAETVVSYPTEVVAIEVPKGAVVGKATDVTVRLRNRRERASGIAKLTMSTDGNVVTFGEEPVEVPAIEPGATVDVVVKMTPTAWVGGSIPVPFRAAIVSDEEKFTQPVLAKFPITRAGSLFLFTQQGTAIEGSTIVARAGSLLTLQAQLKNETTAFRPGPFGIKAAQTSDPAFTNATNTTISITYGSLSPGSQYGAQAFSYFIPESFRGKTVWLVLGAFEGSEWIHLAKVYVTVQ